MSKISVVPLVVAGLLFAGTHVRAQDLEPRRWSHLPDGVDVVGTGFLYTDADISFDPVTKIEDAKATLYSVPVKYVHAFGVLGKSARVEALGAYQDGQWDGLLDGAPRQVSREGMADPIARVAVNFYGAPALSGRDFAAYRNTITNETIVGAALLIRLPLGQYDGDKLINLGQNRYAFAPQIGGVQSWGKWSAELNGTTWFFTDNDDFYIDQTRAQDPLYTAETHVIYTAKPGLWAGVSGGYAYGGESTINGNPRDDVQESIAFALTCGLPITPSLGVKFVYLGTRTQTSLGSDSDTYGTAIAYLW